MAYPKLVSWRYSDGGGIFSSKNDKETVTLYFVNDFETEQALEKSNIIFKEPVSYIAPGLSIEKVEGFTRRARSHGKLLNTYRDKYPELENKYPVKSPSTGDVFGKYIYSNLAHLKNWVNPLTDKYPHYIEKEKYILLSAFEDENFVEDILNFKPLALYNGEITDYQKKYLPNFLKALKYKNSELYSIFLKYPQVQDLDKELNPIGKKAKVTTLNPGEVKLPLTPVLGVKKAIWNGTEIEMLLEENNCYNINKLSFVPNDDYVVGILEESTVNTNTEFV